MAARGNLVVLAVAAVLLLSLLAVAWNSPSPAATGTPDATPAPPSCASQRAEHAVAGGPATSVGASASVRRLVLADPAGQPPAPDAAWLGLPRARRDALPWLVRTPQRADAAHLLRSATFNPRDLWLPEEARDAVASALAETDAAVQALAAALQATADREFAALHARGLTRPVQIGQYEGLLQMEKIGRDPAFRQLDGVTYGVSRVHMPQTRRLERDLREAGAALVQRLAEVFRAAGALTEEERQALAARARSAVGRRS